MDIKKAYQKMQAECGIDVGDKVRVLRTAKCGEMGWYGLCDCTRMQKLNLGQVLKVTMINEYTDGYIELEKRHGGLTFIPFFALELVEKAKPEKMVTVKGSEYSEDTLQKMIEAYVNGKS